MNEREFADGLASNGLIPRSAVVGSVMRAYRLVQHELWQAAAASGQPNSPEGVSQIAGGYQLCWPDTGNGEGCDVFSKFTTDTAGHVTGVSVNGIPVADRIASGPASSMHGMELSGVIAYRSLDMGNKIIVAYRLHDVSYRPINTSPAALAMFGGYSESAFDSADPQSLSPGMTTYDYAVFGTTQVTGTFQLHSNDGYNYLLGSSTLTKP